jgi:hypothetical protein
MRKAGEDVGIQFSFSNTSFPNTLQAHALLEFAAEQDKGVKQNDVAERLFKVRLGNVICNGELVFSLCVIAESMASSSLFNDYEHYC